MTEIKTIFHKNFNFLQSKDFYKLTKKRDFIFDKFFVEYLTQYNANFNYQNISFELNDTKNILFCPLTIETKNSQKNLNFYGRPFVICKNTNNQNVFQKKLFDTLSELIDKNSITNFMLKKYVNDNEINKYMEIDLKNIDAIYTDNVIDLQLPLTKIFKDFSKGHKSAVKKDYSELSYYIYDHNNYKKNQIFEMMELHHIVSNKKTRPEKSWLVNEKMIINGQAFLIKIMNKDKLISYSLFFHGNFYAVYFSSCSIRETFSTFKNLTHKSIWKAIEYLKKIKCSHLVMDKTKTLYSAMSTTDKETSIQRFKRSFGGSPENYIVYKKIPDKI